MYSFCPNCMEPHATSQMGVHLMPCSITIQGSSGKPPPTASPEVWASPPWTSTGPELTSSFTLWCVSLNSFVHFSIQSLALSSRKAGTMPLSFSTVHHNTRPTDCMAHINAYRVKESTNSHAAVAHRVTICGHLRKSDSVFWVFILHKTPGTFFTHDA